MSDPYELLGVAADADDDAIRRRYLELVREFPPERNPEKFAAVRAAYEALKDIDIRLKRRFFERGKQDSLDVLIEEAACRRPRRRVTLEMLVQLAQTRP